MPHQIQLPSQEGGIKIPHVNIGNPDETFDLLMLSRALKPDFVQCFDEMAAAPSLAFNACCSKRNDN
ncbi:MAG: hypothetical protein AAFN08_05930 [Cyanobacteria bacterium J06559_3]